MFRSSISALHLWSVDFLLKNPLIYFTSLNSILDPLPTWMYPTEPDTVQPCVEGNHYNPMSVPIQTLPRYTVNHIAHVAFVCSCLSCVCCHPSLPSRREVAKKLCTVVHRRAVPGGCRSQGCHGYLVSSFSTPSVCLNTFPHPILFKPLSHNSDPHPISPNNNTACLNRQVMRINEMITKDVKL